MTYQEVGALLGEAMEGHGWTHALVANALEVSRPYISNVVGGRNPISAEMLTEILDLIEATPEERARLLDALKAAKRKAERLRDERRQRRARRVRQARPLDMVDDAVPEVTDAEVAQFVGAMKALGFTRAKIEALLATAGIPYYRPYQTAA